MIGWVIEALVASTLLMLVVLALRGPVAARFGAHAAYLLWLLPALRLILPRLPQSAAPVQAVPIHLDIARLVAVAAQQPTRPAMAVLPATTASASTGIDWLMLALLLWLSGAAVYLAWQLGRHRRFMAVALEHARPGYRRGGIKVRLSPIISGPLAAGIFHRHILLPEDFAERYSGAEQRLALEHELAHHRRGDLVANAAALAMLALHWFNPIAHWAYRAFRADQELACDATVLDRAAPESLSAYGSALIKSARAGMPSATCALGSAIELKRRMKMIASDTRSRARRIGGAGLAAILTVAGLGLTASGSIAAPSKMAPVVEQPSFQPAPEARVIVVDENVTRTITTDGGDHMTDISDVSDVQPVRPMPPAPPAQPAAAIAPVRPMAPILPIAPTPLSAAQIARQRQATRQASEEARKAMANVDVDAITREALAQARAELARECKFAKPGHADETDNEAISRLATSCVDMAAIDRQVQDALRQASEEIRVSTDLTNEQRAKAMAAIDRTRAEMASKRRH